MASDLERSSSPSQPTRDLAQTLRRALDDLEQRVRAGERHSCESVLAFYPPIAGDKDALLELIYTEYVVRQELGQPSPLEDWLGRFPAREADIRALFAVHGYMVGGKSAQEFPADSTPGLDSWRFAGDTVAAPRGKRLGNYELLEEIGRGGMGTVYRARQVNLDRHVALKTIDQHAGLQPELLARFRAEAESAARLQHPHIVQIFEVGVQAALPYFTMEYVPGGNLAAVIRQRPLPPRTAASLLEPVARAVHYAHTRDVVHRDLKPANLLVAQCQRADAVELAAYVVGAHPPAPAARYELKITDFGLAKRLDSNTGRTLPGAALGTPSYMAPEQASRQSASAGPACDVYALGAVLYDMLVGRPPFHAATVSETLHRVQHDDPVSIRSVQPNVPRDLETICLKCLQKDSARRYRSAAELADDLSRFLDGRPILARPVSLVERGIKWTRRHPAIAAFFAALFLGACGIGWEWSRAELNRAAAERHAKSALDAQAAERAERQRLERTLYAHDVSLANLEYLSNNTTRARQLLEACPAALRQWEWTYLKQVFDEQQWEFDGLSLPVRGVAMSRDGSLVAGASALWGVDRPGEIKVWDTRTKKLRHTFAGHPSSVMDVAFHPSGKCLASVGCAWQPGSPRGAVIVWDLTTGSELWSLKQANAHSVAFHPRGDSVAVGNTNGKVTVHDADTGQVLRAHEGHRGIVFDLAYHPDGNSLASASRDGACLIWNADSSGPAAKIEGLSDVRSVSWSPAGNEIVVGTFDGHVKIYELGSGPLREKFSYRHGERIAGLRYSPDGQYLVVTAHNDSVRFIDPQTAQVHRELHCHNGVAQDVAFSADGQRLATCGLDGKVNVWNLTLPLRSRKRELRGPFLADLAITPSGQLAALAMGLNNTGVARYEDRSLKLWNLETGQFAKGLAGHTGWLTSTAVDPQGRWLLSGSEDKTAILWNAADGARLHTLTGHAGPVIDVAFLDRGNLAVTAARNGEIRVWNAVTGETQQAWSTPDGQLTAIACHPTQQLVASSGAAGKIMIWRVGSPVAVVHLSRSGGETHDVCFSLSGEYLAAARQTAQVELWRVSDLLTQSNPLPWAVLKGHTESVHSVSFSPDSQRLVSAAADRTVKLWDVTSGLEVISFAAAGLTGLNPKVAFSPDGKRIVHVDQTSVNIWEVAESAASDAAATHTEKSQIAEWHKGELQRASTGEHWFALAHHAGQLAQLEPGRPQLHRQRGLALARLNRWTEAVTELNTSLTLDPAAATFADLVLLQLQQGDRAAHERTCAAFLEAHKSTTNPQTLNSLAWSACLAPDVVKEHTDIVELTEQAYARRKSSALLSTLGAVHLRSGQPRLAIEELMESLRQEATHPVPQDWVLLALAQAELGQYAAAAEGIGKTRDWLADQDHKRETRQPVDSLNTWRNRLELGILLREAEALVAAKK